MTLSLLYPDSVGKVQKTLRFKPFFTIRLMIAQNLG
jgi:hypothetical protein